MTEEADHECAETYNDCMASRQARVRGVILADPAKPLEELAATAGVSRQAISRHRRSLMAEGLVPADLRVVKSDGRSIPARQAELHAREVTPLLKLKDLYADDVPYWSQRQVKAVEAALQECSREQLAYLFSEVLPIFHDNLRKGNVR